MKAAGTTASMSMSAPVSASAHHLENEVPQVAPDERALTSKAVLVRPM